MGRFWKNNLKIKQDYYRKEKRHTCWRYQEEPIVITETVTHEQKYFKSSNL